MTKKKLSRKELLKQEDEFITLSQQTIQFLVARKKQFITIASLFFGVLVLVAGFRYFSEKAENNSFVLLSKALNAYEAQKAEKDPEQALLAVEGDFQKLVKKYSGKKGAVMGRVFLGRIYQEAGKPQKALETYKEALEDFDSADPIYFSIISAMGYAKEAAGDLAGAAEDFKRVVDAEPAVSKDLALFNLGRIYEAMGNEQKSLAAYEKLTSEYKNSLYFDLANDKVNQS